MVKTAVQAQLEAFEERLPGISESPEAALALSLAGRVDDAHNSATSVSLCAGRLLETLAALRVLVPEVKKESPLDEIKARRDAKLAVGKPDAADRARRKRSEPS